MTLTLSASAQASTSDAPTRYAPPSHTTVLTTFVRDGARVPLLYASGDLELLNRPSVAIVGSRAASAHGLALAATLARDLARAGVVIMSGLARGIDAAAHRAAMASGGRTIAVIGTPLDRAYPAEHASLQTEIYRDQLLLSPFPVGAHTLPAHFPVRNRIIAALARATFIVEAGEKSGTMHQIRKSLELGRPVFIAESLATSTDLRWPKRLLRYTNVFVARSARDVCSRLRAS